MTREESWIRECRVLLGPSGWSGKDLPIKPTYQQLFQFLVTMMDVLVDGTLKRDEEIPTRKVPTGIIIEVAHAKTESGKTTRRQRQRIVSYKLYFFPPEYDPPKEYPTYGSLERATHLSLIQ